MMPPHNPPRGLLALLVVLVGAVCARTGPELARVDAAERSPFFHLRQRRPESVGPAEETLEPEEIREVRIGYFGPSDPSDPVFGHMWRAAELAVELANQQGGLSGKPFRLVPAWSANPWGTGVRQLVRAVYEERLRAIVGGVDSASTHLAEQVVAKARLVLVSPACSDKTANLAGVPWIFSCLPGDHLQVIPLARAIARGRPRLVILAAADQHDGRLFERELTAALARHKLTPHYRFAFASQALETEQLVRRVLAARPGTVAVAARAGASAQIVSALRRGGFSGEVFGGMWMARRRFLEDAGPSAEGVVFPLVWTRSGSSEPFVRLFRQRTGHEPDYAAAHTFDAVNLVIEAIRRAGLNRTRIRDAVAQLSPWGGVTGTIVWDPVGSNTRPVALGTIRDGRVELREGPPASTRVKPASAETKGDALR
ncbi:MAG TPA: ABC transporter substrate-binding protein [Planctomycetaceae bacterium]|nr:ABC transporter substrate-binding protein [Planctomycetaceae bacterium]